MTEMTDHSSSSGRSVSSGKLSVGTAEVLREKMEEMSVQALLQLAAAGPAYEHEVREYTRECTTLPELGYACMNVRDFGVLMSQVSELFPNVSVIDIRNMALFLNRDA